MGDAPGTVAKLHQKRVSYLIQLGKAMMAFDKDITEEKIVKEIWKAMQRVGLLHDCSVKIECMQLLLRLQLLSIRGFKWSLLDA
jgi:hypothetical protein